MLVPISFLLHESGGSNGFVVAACLNLWLRSYNCFQALNKNTFA